MYTNGALKQGRTLPINLFGPQLTHVTPRQAVDIVRAIQDNSKFEFIHEAIFSTREILGPLQKAIPAIDAGRLLSQLETLNYFIDAGVVPEQASLGSSFFAVLTVIKQAIDYLALGTAGNPQGFCLGFVTAAAAVSAQTEAEFERYIKRALNLAICIGAVADANDVDGLVQTYSVQWQTHDYKELLEHWLERNPSSYVCCSTDVNRITIITVPTTDESQFLKEVSKADLRTVVVGLRQRYHWQQREELIDGLKQLCATDERLRLPDASELHAPLRSNIDGQVISCGDLTCIAVQSLLVKPSKWFDVVSAAIKSSGHPRPDVIQLGSSSSLLPVSLSASAIKVPKNQIKRPSIPSYEPIAVTSTITHLNQSINQSINQVQLGSSHKQLDNPCIDSEAEAQSREPTLI